MNFITTYKASFDVWFQGTLIGNVRAVNRKAALALAREQFGSDVTVSLDLS
jgi:hypothetical protein